MNTLELKREVRLLKSFAISVLGNGKDEYKKSFVDEVLKSAGEKPVGEFLSKKDFLKILKK